MGCPDYLTDVRPWIIAAVILAFIIGDPGSFVADVVLVVLVLQITASMIGIQFKADLIRGMWREILLSVFFCFIVNSGLTIVCAYVFPSDDIGLFYGWIMIAATPCAVSCVTVALTMYGNRVLSVLGLAIIYIVALFATPLITTIFIGDAISPLEILKYIFLFVAVPLLATIPLNRFNIPRKPKAVFINLMMFILVMLSVARNRDYFLDSVDIIGWIVLFAVFRTFVFGGVLLYIFRRIGTDRGNAIDYVSLSVWKNTGLAMSMSLILLPGMPQAAVPCAVCLLVEALWYAVNNSIVNRRWPPELKEDS